MTFPFVLHGLFAIFWVILNKGHTLGDFIVGAVIGFLLLSLFPKLLNAKEYVRRILGFFRFIAYFSWIFVKSNLAVARQVLFVPRHKIRGRLVDLPIEELKSFEAILCAHFITLTPGTTSVDICDHPKRIIVHSMGGADDSTVRATIDREIITPILEFTR